MSEGEGLGRLGSGLGSAVMVHTWGGVWGMHNELGSGLGSPLSVFASRCCEGKAPLRHCRTASANGKEG